MGFRYRISVFIGISISKRNESYATFRDAYADEDQLSGSRKPKKGSRKTSTPFPTSTVEVEVEVEGEVEVQVEVEVDVSVEVERFEMDMPMKTEIRWDLQSAR